MFIHDVYFNLGDRIFNASWYKNGEDLEYDRRDLVIKNLIESDTGEYVCITCTKSTCTNMTFNLLIEGNNLDIILYKTM